MRTTDFNATITADQLNESMFKKFGSRVEFDKYTREELENYRNLLRTKLTQTETVAGFNELLANEGYQKDKFMLNLLNTRIKEMLGESKKQLSEKAVSKSQQQAAGVALAAKKAGKTPAGKGAAAEMAKMPKKELEKFAGTKHKGLPKKVKENTEWDDPVDQFVNTSDVNYEAPDEYDYGDKAQRMFLRHLKKLGIRVTGVNDDADPVIIAMNGDKMVAWFDVENAHGHIPNTNAMAESKKDKPDFLDMDKDGDKKEPMKKAVKDKNNAKGAMKDMFGGSAKDLTSKLKIKEGPDSEVHYGSITHPDGEGEELQYKFRVKNGKPVVVGCEDDRYWDECQADAEKYYHQMAEGYDTRDAYEKHDPKHPDFKKNYEKFKAANPSKKLADFVAKMKGSKIKEGAKPDFLDLDKDGNKKEPMKKAAKDKKKVKEGAMKQNYNIIIESLKQFIAEDEEGKAKDITAGTDMVNDFTSWMQRVGQYQTKSMIELSDSIRANFGQAEADAFKNAIQPALDETLSALTQSRETLTRAVATLAGEESAEPMGMGGDELVPDMGTDLAEPDTMNEPGDDFGAADAAAGGAEAAGRGLRESRTFKRAQKLAEAHSIMSRLAR